jgi:outer membrane protein TolC
VRQRHHDVAARLTAELVLVRDAERTLALLRNEVVPVARRLSDSARTGYELGSIPQRDWLEARRLQVDTERMLVEARSTRETALARVEALTGLGLADTEPLAEVSHE